MEDRVLGKHSCGICGYRNDSEIEIFNHIMKIHPNIKEEIRERWRSAFQ
jgi:hypothetical protein